MGRKKRSRENREVSNTENEEGGGRKDIKGRDVVGKRAKVEGEKSEKDAIRDEKNSVKKKADDVDIDELFEGLKARKEEKKGKEQKQAEAHTSDADPGRADDRVKGSKDDIFGQQKKSSRGITEEGYAIYGEDELKLNSTGGDTPLCPFDCDCCF